MLSKNSNIGENMKKFSAIFLVFVILAYSLVTTGFNSFLTNNNNGIAYADEEKDKKSDDKSEDKSDSKDGESEDKTDESESDSKDSDVELDTERNMYVVLKDDTEKLEAVKESLKYSEQLQYLTTYTILKSAYMEDGYNSIYLDNNGWANGAESSIGININTGYKQIVDEESASNSHEEKEIEENKKKEETGEGESEAEKAKAELTKVLEDKLQDLYLLKFLYSKNSSSTEIKSLIEATGKNDYGVNYSDTCLKYGVGAINLLFRCTNSDGKYEEGVNILDTGRFTYPQGFGYNPKSASRGTSTQAFKTAKSKFDDKNSAYYDVNTVITTIINKGLSDGEKGLENLIDKDIYDTENVGKINKALSSWIKNNNAVKSNLDKVSVAQIENEFFVVPITEKDSSKAKKLYDKYAEVAQIMPTSARMDSTRQAKNGYEDNFKQWKKDTATAVSKVKNKDKALELVESEKSSGVEKVTKGNIRTLGWLPLEITVEQFMKTSDKDKYAELIKSYDGGVTSESSKYRVVRSESNGDSAGGRYLRTNDFFNNEIKTVDDIRNSSSPYLSFNTNTYGNNKGNAYISTSSEKLQKSNGHLGLYSGIKVNDVKSMKTSLVEFKNQILSGKFYDSKTGVAVALSLSEIQKRDTRPVHKMIAYRTSQKKLNNSSNSQYVVGVDNYGNLIAGNDLKVIVPYWQNTAIDELDGLNSMSDSYVVSPILKAVTEDERTNIAKDYKAVNLKEKSSKIKSSDELTMKEDKVAEFNTYLKSLNASSTDGVQAISKSLSETKAVQAYALIITQQTKSSVKKWNQRFNSTSESLKEVYMINDDAGQQSTKDDKSSVDSSFSEKDLLEKLRMFFDGGAYDLIKRTIISFVVSFYTSSVFNFTLGNTFHTTLITETTAWTEILPALITVLVAFLGAYIVYMGILIMRKTMTWKQFVVQFIAVSCILLIPNLIYTPLINTAINNPTEKIMGKQMEQMSIIDTNLAVQEKKRTEDDNYKLLYGDVDELRDRAEDYIVPIYTTTHVDGFDVANMTYDELPEKNKEKNRVKLENNTWKETDLVSINVSIFDIFEWVSSEENNSTPLFDWLESKDSERYKDVSKYTELSYDTLEKYTSWIEKDEIANQGLSGQEFTASEIYKMIYTKTQDEKISNAINGVYNISTVFRNRENAVEMNLVSDGQRANFVRDLSMTAKSRTIAFGAPNKLSPTSEALFTNYANEDDIPDTDIFGLTDVVSTLVPYQQHNAPTLSRNVYEINKDILNQYITNYSIVRESLGSENADVKLAEFKIISLNMWFRINDELKLNLFPTSYKASTVSLDSYMRLVFIPMADYKDLEDNSVNNVSKYIALREQVVPLLAFLCAIIAIMLFGLVYLAIFSGLMMVLMLFSFFYNYIWKKNFESKAWLGSLMIIGTFALIKIGLLLVWYAMSYLLNYQYVIKGGNTYAYTIIHSIAITAYVVFAFKKGFIPLFKHVTSDLSNLGADSMLASGKALKGNFVGKLVNALKEGGQNGLGRAGRIAGASVGLAGAGIGVGKGIKNLLASEGTEATLANNNLKRQSASFAKPALKSLLDRKSSKSDERDIVELKNIANGEVKSSGESTLADKIDGSVTGLKRLSTKALAKTLDKIEAVNLNRSYAKEIKALSKTGSYMSILTSSNNGVKVTEIPIGNKQVATQIGMDLAEKGFSSIVTPTGNLIFDSTSLDYANSNATRKGIFGSSLINLAQNIKNLKKAKKQKISDIDATIGYTMISPNTISLMVGTKGIAKSSIATILDSDIVKKNFEIVSKPILTDEGTYTDDNIKFIVKTQNTNISEVMAQIAKTDSALRQSKESESERVVMQHAQSLVFGNATDIEIAKKHLVSGMYLQDGKVLYSSMNSKHVSAVKDMQTEMNKSVNSERKVKSDILTRLTSQVVNGENNGYLVTESVINPSENTSATRQLRNYGLQSFKEQTSKVFTGKYTKDVVDILTNMQAYMNDSSEEIKNFAKISKESVDNVEKFFGIKDEKVTHEKLANYVNKMTDKAMLYSENNAKVRDLKNEFKLISEQFDAKEIKAKDYTNILTSLKTRLKDTLQEDGILSQTSVGVLTESVSTMNNKSALYDSISNNIAEYKESTQKLNKEDLNSNALEKLMMNDSSKALMDNLSSFSDNIKHVSANNDGTVNLTMKNYDMSSDEITKALKTLVPSLDEK